MRKYNVKSLMILTVHDSILFDIYPGEFDLMLKIVREGMLALPEMCVEFYNWTFDFPMQIEVKSGDNWLDMAKVGVYDR